MIQEYVFRVLRICNVIKQNEPEVGNDILLISYYFDTSNISQKNLKPDTCETLQDRIYNYCIFIKGAANVGQKGGFNIYIII